MLEFVFYCLLVVGAITIGLLAKMMIDFWKMRSKSGR